MRMKNNKHKFWREWVLGPVIALMIIAPFKSAIADWNWVPSGSMKPSIFEGELALVNKLAYDLKVPFTTIHLSTWGNPERGDVVVFYSPKDGTRLVKRVIGLPGDTIEMRDEVLYVNGTAERYSPADATPFLPGIFEDQRPTRGDRTSARVRPLCHGSTESWGHAHIRPARGAKGGIFHDGRFAR